MIFLICIIFDLELIYGTERQHCSGVSNFYLVDNIYRIYKWMAPRFQHNRNRDSIRSYYTYKRFKLSI